MTSPTPRELQCLDYVTRKDATIQSAARELGVKPSTVKEHLSRLYRKLGVSDRAEAVRVVSGWRVAA